MRSSLIYRNWLTTGGSYSPEVLDYEARVIAEGGAFQENDLSLLDENFIVPLKTSGTWNKILDCGFFLGGFAGSKVKLKYADPTYKNLLYTSLVSGDYSETTGLSATATGRKADTQFNRSAVGLAANNFSMGYFSLDDFQTTNTFLMCDNLVSGAAGTFLTKTSHGLNAAVTPPTNRSVTIPQVKLGDPRFHYVSSNGDILWGWDFVWYYPLPAAVDTPNLDLSTPVSLFSGRNNGSTVNGTGRLGFYFIGSYLTYDEIVEVQQCAEAFLIAKGRITDSAVMLAFGDSVTRGTGATVFSDRYSYVLANSWGVRERCLGINSSRLAGSDTTVSGGYDRRSQLLKYRHPAGSKVVLQYGINDINQDGNASGTPALIADFKTKYKTVVTDLLAAGYGVDDIYIGSPGYINNGASTTKMEAYGTPCMEIAQETGIWYAPIRERMITGGGNTLLADTLHPNTAGHALMADTYVNHSVKIP